MPPSASYGRLMPRGAGFCHVFGGAFNVLPDQGARSPASSMAFRTRCSVTTRHPTAKEESLAGAGGARLADPAFPALRRRDHCLLNGIGNRAIR